MHASCVLGWTQNQFSKCINHSRFQIVEYMLTRRLEWFFFIWILNDQHFYYISHNIIQIHTTCKRLYLLGKKEKKKFCTLLWQFWCFDDTYSKHVDIFFSSKNISFFLIVFFKDCDIDCNRFFWKKIFWLLSRIFSRSARPFSCLAQIKFRISL